LHEPGDQAARDRIAYYFSSRNKLPLPGNGPVPTAENGVSPLIRNFSDNGYLGQDKLRGVCFFLSDAEFGALEAGTSARISGKEKDAVYHIHDRVVCSGGTTAGFSAGDTVDVIHTIRPVKRGGGNGKLMRRVALGMIDERSGTNATVTIVKMWDIVRNGALIAPAARFSDHAIEAVEDVSAPVEGRIVDRVEKTALCQLYQSVLIDKGVGDQVQLGDIFLVYPANSRADGDATAPSMAVCALYAGQTTSTAMIIEIFTDKLASGDRVQLVKRMRLGVD
jgi:hypothetical protein